MPPLSFYLWFGAVITPVALIVLGSFRLYRSARTARLSQELVALIEGMFIVVALAGLASYFTKGELSRGFLVTFVIIATITLLTSRLTIRGVLRALRRGGRNQRHVLVVGVEEPALSLLRKMRQHRDYGLVVEGLVAVTPEAVGSSVEGVPVIGTVSELPRLVESTGAELVYIALPRSAYLRGARGARPPQRLDRRGAAGSGSGVGVHAQRRRRGFRRHAGGARDRDTRSRAGTRC